jgi:hypothetical protein
MRISSRMRRGKDVKIRTNPEVGGMSCGVTAGNLSTYKPTGGSDMSPEPVA